MTASLSVQPPTAAATLDERQLSETLVEGIVTLAYKALLHREPDSSGVEHHRAVLRSYGDIPDLVRSITFSEEARLKRTTGLQLAKFLVQASDLSPDTDDRLDMALARAAVACLAADRDLHLPIDSAPEKPGTDVTSVDTGNDVLLLSTPKDDLMTVLVLGGATRSLRVTQENDAVWSEIPLERHIELCEVRLPLKGKRGEDLRIGLSGSRHYREIPGDGSGFAGLVDAIIESRAHELCIPGIDRPIVANNSFRNADNETALRTLYQIYGRATKGIQSGEPSDRDLLAWYTLDLPGHAGPLGRIELPPKIREQLLQEVIGPDLLGYSVNRQIFLFAHRHGLLAQLCASTDGLVETYRKFLTSPSYHYLAKNDLIPASVLAALGAPVSVNGVRMNKFWKDLLQEIVGQVPLDRFAAEELQGMLAERFGFALLNNLFEPLVPLEWFSNYRNSRRQAGQSRPVGRTKRDPLLRRRQEAALALLRDHPIERLRSEGWAGVHESGSSAKASPQVEKLITVVGHRGGSGLAKTVPMFREALEGIGFGHRLLQVEGMEEVDVHWSADLRQPGRPVNLFAVNADTYTTAAIRLAAMEPAAADTLRIGSFFWETSRAPHVHRLAAPFVDEVWTSTTFLQKVYADLYDGKVPVRTMGMSVSVPKEIQPFPFWSLGLPADEFVFLNVSDFDSSIVRKHPLAVVQAFRKAFPAEKDVRLVLKIRRIDLNHWSNTNHYWTRVVQAIGNDPRITILTGDLSEADYWSLLASSDCYVTLHRGEGFGYGAAHAMLLDVPVIATDYSGTRDFCTKNTSLLVPAEEIPVAIGDMPFREDLGVWAEPDVEAAVVQMRQVRENAAPIRAMVRRAHEEVTALYSPKALQGRIAERLKECGV